MFRWFMAGWLIVGLTIVFIVVSVYRTIIETEDGSDWFYE
jgi:hypothetical protein